MSETIQNTAQVFSRTFMCTLVLLLCPLMLFYGCMVADDNTRMIGFDDASPSVNGYLDETGIHIELFGAGIVIPDRALQTAAVVGSYVWTAIPPSLRLAAQTAALLAGQAWELVSSLLGSG